MEQYQTLKTKLLEKKVPEKDIDSYLNYLLDSHREEEKRQKKDPSKGAGAIRSNSVDTLYSLFIKYRNLGLPIDGTNVVIAGKNMAMVTYNGYKNKVKQSYPSATFDIQLVREGDTFKFSKTNGRMTYSHEFGNPFEDSQIIGAYCIIEIDDKQYFESLNTADFDKMKKSSKQKYLWGEWASEFWLKSVLKRACKRHFYDIVKEIDKNDNDDFGVDESADDRFDKLQDYIDSILQFIQKAPDLDALKDVWMKNEHKEIKELQDAKDKRKAELMEKNNASSPNPSTTSPS